MLDTLPFLHDNAFLELLGSESLKVKNKLRKMQGSSLTKN